MTNILDDISEFSAVERGACTIVLNCCFPFKAEVLFRGFTEPEYIRQWLLGGPGWTMPVCDYDPQPGGAYRFGWRGPDGEERGMTGVITAIEPGKSMHSLERYDGEGPERDMVIAMNFSDVPSGGRLSLAITYPDAQSFRTAVDGGLADGMRRGFATLNDVLGQKNGR